VNVLIATHGWESNDHARWLARSLAAAGDRPLVLALEGDGRGVWKRTAERGFDVAFLGTASTQVDIERTVAALRSEQRFDVAHFHSVKGPLARVAVELDCAGIPLVHSALNEGEGASAAQRRLYARFTRVMTAENAKFLTAGVDPQKLVSETGGPSPWARAPAGFDDGLQPILRVYGEVLEERAAPKLPPVDRLVAVVLHQRGLSQTLASVKALDLGTRRPDALVAVTCGGFDGAASFLRSALPNAQVLDVEDALRFADAANLGLARAMALGADQVLFLSGEVEVAADTVSRLTASLARFPELGVVGPALREKSAPDRLVTAGMRWSARSGRVKHTGRGDTFRPAADWELQQVDGLSSLALLVRRTALDAVGLFDRGGVPGFLALDFCLRARGKGFGVACAPAASALHAPAPVERHPLQRLFEARAQLRLAQAHAPKAALPSLARGAAIVASHAVQAAEKRAPGGARAAFALVRAGIAALSSGARSMPGL
jgi:GT2 family glycosyltransferase